MSGFISTTTTASLLSLLPGQEHPSCGQHSAWPYNLFTKDWTQQNGCGQERHVGVCFSFCCGHNKAALCNGWTAVFIPFPFTAGTIKLMLAVWWRYFCLPLHHLQAPAWRSFVHPSGHGSFVRYWFVVRGY